VDLATAKETLLTPHKGPGSFGGAFSRDGRTVYLAENSGRDASPSRGTRLGADGAPGPTEVLAARADAELSDFEIDDAGTKAALLWKGGQERSRAFRPESGKALSRPKLPAEIAGG